MTGTECHPVFNVFAEIGRLDPPEVLARLVATGFWDASDRRDPTSDHAAAFLVWDNIEERCRPGQTMLHHAGPGLVIATYAKGWHGAIDVEDQPFPIAICRLALMVEADARHAGR